MALLRLEVLRKERGLHQATFAYLLGCAQGRYSEYARAKRRPSPGRLARMASVLGWQGPPEALLESVSDNELPAEQVQQ
jgi:transcriptional regulator with XRE-family HTH domain